MSKPEVGATTSAWMEYADEVLADNERLRLRVVDLDGQRDYWYDVAQDAVEAEKIALSAIGEKLAQVETKVERLRAVLQRIHDAAAELGSEISAEWLVGTTAAALGQAAEGERT